MLIPGKSHSRVERGNSGSWSRLSLSTKYVPFTNMIGVGLLAGAWRGGDHRPAPNAVPDRCWDPIAACRWWHSGQWHAQNVTKRPGWLQGERDWGSAMASLSDASGQSVDIAGGQVRETAGSGRVSGAVVHVSKQAGNAMGGRDRWLDTGYGRPQARHWTRPENQPTSQGVGTFDVCSNAAVNSDLSCFL